MPDRRAKWAAELRRLQRQMSRLHAGTPLRSWSLGVPEWDWRLCRIGREWMTEYGPPSGRTSGFDGHRTTPAIDVYLATQVHEHGGHTGLIGDFVRALGGTAPPERASDTAQPHLIVTNVHEQNRAAISEPIRSRLALPSSGITVLTAPSLAGRVDQLLARLVALRPKRLFLFHHPDDPLASVAAQPEIARTRVLVHHADYLPSFGMYVPGVRLLDLTASAAAFARFLRRAPAWLPLTAPDPGPRPYAFLGEGRLVTASCGGAHKFSSGYAFSYPETVGIILRATGGRHVHIGGLDQKIRSQIAKVLRRANVGQDRFVYVPHTSSVAATLWAHRCDLYCASFPIDGARTRIEAIAAGIPYLGHSTRPAACASEAAADDMLVWREFDDLSATLARLTDVATLEEQAARGRTAYERQHHPRVFARHLADILDGGPGCDDPQWRSRVDGAIAEMLTAVQRDLHLLTVRRGLWRQTRRFVGRVADWIEGGR